MERKHPERDIQNAILNFLRLKRVFCWRQKNTGVFHKSVGRYIPSGMVGVSDIMGVMPDGRFLAIEVKAANGKVSVPQETFLMNVRNNKGLALVARSVDDVEELLAKTNQ